MLLVLLWHNADSELNESLHLIVDQTKHVGHLCWVLAQQHIEDYTNVYNES